MSSIKPYQNSKLGKSAQVERMFDNISIEYDNLNRVISFGLDIRWRKKLVKMAAECHPRDILDVATGTGDLAIALSVIDNSEIIGVDISKKMMETGKKKLLQLGLQNRITLCIANVEHLPFDNDSFDVITVAFGVRNFENLKTGLLEIKRVLRPGGSLLILETSVPSNPLLRLGYSIHSKIFLPLIGRLFSNDKKAYSYLAKSASEFPYGESFVRILSEGGYSNSKYHTQSFGAATIYSAKKS